jgi:UDP-GlcNAc:undecaprenyl-phosphate GlcNAc-1-phosphate transferase
MMPLLVFLIALAASLLLTPLSIAAASRAGWYERSGAHKIHDRQVPFIGGTAIGLSLLASIALSRIVWPAFAAGVLPKLIALLAGGLLIYGIGLYDDARGASVLIRLLIQLLAGLALILGGFCVSSLPNPAGGTFHLGPFSVPFTLLWIMFMVNAINFIDGLDGLATGISLIAAVTLLVSALAIGDVFVAFLAAAVAGALLGFLPFNFHPARVFMGDSGSTLVGLMLAAMTTLGTMKSVATITLLVPIAALGVPIFDTISSIVRRTRKGRKIYQADREHIHHFLMSTGFSHRGAVLFLYGMTAFLAVLAVLLASADRRLVGVLVVLFLVLSWVFLEKWSQRGG